MPSFTWQVRERRGGGGPPGFDTADVTIDKREIRQDVLVALLGKAASLFPERGNFGRLVLLID